jgi:signal transduction histidine kinase
MHRGDHALVGALSLHLSASEPHDSSAIVDFDTSAVHDHILDQISGSISQFEFSVPYELVSWEGKKPEMEGLTTKSYLDIFTEKEYAIRIRGYSIFLLRRILPQILFSVFLFGVTALAFALIVRSMRHERKLASLKNDFISNMTHELKTPITTVGVAMEALSHFDVLKNPVKTKEYLDISKAELDRLAILVDKVLKMSVFEGNGIELKLERLDMKNLITGILKTMQVQFDKREAIVQLRTSGEDFTLDGDKTHLVSVIYNLVDNALKYTSDKPQIDIALQQANAQLILEISDNGSGIPSEYQKRIFEKFFRVPTGDEHNVKGHGLGLNYIAGIVKQHQGERKPGESRL